MHKLRIVPYKELSLQPIGERIERRSTVRFVEVELYFVWKYSAVHWATVNVQWSLTRLNVICSRYLGWKWILLHSAGSHSRCEQVTANRPAVRMKPQLAYHSRLMSFDDGHPTLRLRETRNPSYAAVHTVFLPLSTALFKDRVWSDFSTEFDNRLFIEPSATSLGSSAAQLLVAQSIYHGFLLPLS